MNNEQQLINRHIDHVMRRCPDANTQDLLSYINGCTWRNTNVEIGRGEDATVYKVCRTCNDNEDEKCDFVVKVINNANLPRKELYMSREVFFQNEFNNLGLAPTLYDSFICDDKGYIISDKKDYDIQSYIKVLKKKFIPNNEIKDIITQIYENLITIITNLHTNYQLVHGDIHKNNVMIDLQFKDLNLIKSWTNIQFIDFNKACYTDEIEYANSRDINLNLDTILIELKLTFDMIIKDVNLSNLPPPAPRKSNKSGRF